ncbi:hypothetical protein ACVMDN_001079 [Bradyrhizobium sp. USDA 4510]
MQSVRCVKQLLWLRVSPVAPLTRLLFVPSIYSRRPYATKPLRGRRLMLANFLLRRLLRVAHRPNPRRCGQAKDQPRKSDADSQDGEEK